MKILIYQPHRYGDIFQIFPVLKSIKKQIPHSKIHFLVDDAFKEILRHNKYIDKVISFPYLKIIKELKYKYDLNSAINIIDKFLNSLKKETYDIVINYNYSNLSGFITGQLINSYKKYGKIVDLNENVKVTGNWAKYLLFFVKDRKMNKLNLVEIFYKIAEEAIYPHIKKLRYYPLYNDYKNDLKVEKWLKSNDISTEDIIIGIQIGASKKYRRLLNEKYIELINMFLKDGNKKIILIGSKEEKDESKKIKNTVNGKIYDATGKFSLNGTFNILKRLSLFITVDTLNMHLASAAGIKVLSIFYGEAYPYETAPFYDGVYVVSPVLSCFPCDDFYKCNKNKICFSNISAKVLYEISTAILKDNIPIINLNKNYKIYMTSFNSERGLSLKLINKVMDIEDLRIMFFKELYYNSFCKIFNLDTNNNDFKNIRGIWGKYDEIINKLNERELFKTISIFKYCLNKYIELNTIVNDGSFYIEKILKKDLSEDVEQIIYKILEKINKKLNEEDEITNFLRSYYKVNVMNINNFTDLIQLNSVFNNMKNILNNLIYSLMYVLQKLYEKSFSNLEELIKI